MNGDQQCGPYANIAPKVIGQRAGSSAHDVDWTDNQADNKQHHANVSRCQTQAVDLLSGTAGEQRAHDQHQKDARGG
jgi:hypothetical protein